MAGTQYVKIQFPEQANELTIEQYQKYVKIEEGESNFKTLKAAEIFLGLPIREALKMKTQDFYDMTNELFSIIGQDHKLQPIVKYRGIEYGFIPNIEELTFGEYIDLDSYLTDVQNMHKAMGVLYRPITDRVGDKYDIEDYEPNDGYKDFPLGAGLGATLFFWTLRKELSSDTPNSSEKNPKDILTSAFKPTSQGSGVGMEA
tara:strand:+ start:2131 stop:2736 length:606 start_codon:yes stop_codon:yes gene_type:complete